MNPGTGDDILVLARGELALESSALAVRLALALPLGGLQARLVLADSASALALADPPDLTPWSGALTRELEALIDDPDVPVSVEADSLASIGLGDRPLREGIEVVSRQQVLAACASSRSCLVL
jgi:hypothetical protein